MILKKADLLNYPAIILLCIQFYSKRLEICTLIDNTGIKHVFLVLAIIYGCLPDLRSYGIRLKSYAYEVKRIVITVIVLIILTFIYMAVNGFTFLWVPQVYFFLAPILFVYVLFKNDHTIKRFQQILNIYTYILSVLFVFYIIQRIAAGTALYFSFVESESPFESEVAHMFLMLYMFYTYIGDKRKRIITAIFCILAWKRMCLVYLVIYTVLSWVLPKDKKVSKKYYIITMILFSLIPSLMHIILSDSFSNWFNTTFGIDLVDFMQFRFQTLSTAFQSNIPSQGLGTFMDVDVLWYGSYVHLNMHNDIVRIYLEVSIVGLMALLYGFASIATNIYSYLVILYIFIELAASHLLGNGGTPFWILAYTLIFCFNHYSKNKSATNNKIYETINVR